MASAAANKPTASRASRTVAAKVTSPPRPVSKKDSDLSSSTTTEGDKGAQAPKRIPPIKAPVGLAKGPDLKNCKSKVGSLNNIKHTPTGGGVTIPSQKLQWNAKSKVGSLENKEHKPGGGNLKVESRKLEWKTSSKVQSLQNVHHKPGGGNVKIFNESYLDKSATSTDTKDQPTAAAPSSSTSSASSSSKTNETNGFVKPLTKDMKGLSLLD